MSQKDNKRGAAQGTRPAQGRGQFWDEAPVDNNLPQPVEGADESPLQSGPAEVGGRQPSTAPGAALDSAGSDDLGYDSPPVTSSDISNTEVEGYDHMTPYYPPGGGGKGRKLEKSANADTPQRDKNDKPAL